MSAILLRFIWNVPLKFKRKFIAAIDAHLSDRYPMFKGLSQGWPAQNGIPPYIRSPEERAKDFELVNQGYLGYMNLGYSAREVDLLVWLETLRDKQCEDRAVRTRRAEAGRASPRAAARSRSIFPEMLRLLGTGRFQRGARTDRELQSAAGRHRPGLPAGTAMPGRLHADRTADRDRPARMVPARAREARATRRRPRERSKSWVSPWAKAEKPPIAVIGSGPAGLINAYLLAARGLPGHDLRGVPRTRRRAALRHPRIPAAELR